MMLERMLLLSARGTYDQYIVSSHFFAASIGCSVDVEKCCCQSRLGAYENRSNILSTPYSMHRLMKVG